MSQDVTISREGQTLVVEVDESLLIDSAPGVRAALEDIDSFHPSEVVVDLSTVTEVDSSGLAAVMRLHRVQRAKGFELVVIASTAQLDRVLAITRLDRVLRIRTTRAAPV